MKKITTLFLFVWTAFSLSAQICQRDSSILADTSVLISPLPFTPDNPVYGLGVACIGQPYSQSVTIEVPETFTFNGVLLPLVSAQIATTGAIANLPAGITYLCDPPDCVFQANTLGCILLYGTPTPANNAPDTVELVISATVNTPFVPIPIQFPGPIAPGTYPLPVQPVGAPVCISSTGEAGNPLVAEISATPNPASDFVMIKVHATESATFQLQLFDAFGRNAYSQRVYLLAGNNQVRIETAHLPLGMYIYSLANEHGRISKRLVINR